MHFQFTALLSALLRPQAYLDPGSGSLIVQLIIAGLAGAAIIIGAYWKKIKKMFTRSNSVKEDEIEIKEDDSHLQQ